MTTAARNLRNKEIFQSGQGEGIWIGKGIVTKTPPAPTLIVMGLPPGGAVSDVRALFEMDPGFVNFRTARRLCFVTFETAKHAVAAARRHQGEKLAGCGDEAGISIDFDKDPTAKRNKQHERQRMQQSGRQGGRGPLPLVCLACGARALELGPTEFLRELPKRATDGASVLSLDPPQHKPSLAQGATQPHPLYEALLDAAAAPGKAVHVRRAKGLERQCRLFCDGCGLPVAYMQRALEGAPRGTPLYIVAGAVGTQRDHDVALARHMAGPDKRSRGGASTRTSGGGRGPGGRGSVRSKAAPPPPESIVAVDCPGRADHPPTDELADCAKGNIPGIDRDATRRRDGETEDRIGAQDRNEPEGVGGGGGADPSTWRAAKRRRSGPSAMQ